MLTANFSDLLAAKMRTEHQALAARWFQRLVDLLPVGARDVFPSDSLLDHVPALILEISDYLRRPEGEAIVSNTAILDKATELGALRHSQQASLHQVLREYQLLSTVLTIFVNEELEKSLDLPSPQEVIQVVSRLHNAVDVLSQATVEAFVGMYTGTIAEQTERLDQLTRLAAHEWRQPVGVLQFGVRLLRDGELDRAQTDRTLASLERNVQHLVNLTHKLESLARVRNQADNPVVQEVSIAAVAREAARQLEEMAAARDVEIRIDSTLPTITVDVGRLELVFVNLLSNAIKYSDPAKPVRRVEVRADRAADHVVQIQVQDNGIGIPDMALEQIFRRFTRAHADRAELRHVPGVGLGLSIVEDCVRAMDGQITVHSSEKHGTTFTITLQRC